MDQPPTWHDFLVASIIPVSVPNIELRALWEGVLCVAAYLQSYRVVIVGENCYW